MDDQYQEFQDQTAAPEEGLENVLSSLQNENVLGDEDDLVSTEKLADDEDKEDSFDDKDE